MLAVSVQMPLALAGLIPLQGLWDPTGSSECCTASRE